MNTILNGDDSHGLRKNNGCEMRKLPSVLANELLRTARKVAPAPFGDIGHLLSELEIPGATVR